MKLIRFVALAGAVFLATMLIPTTIESAEPIAEEEAAVRAVIQLYFDGIIQYDEAALRKAFDPEADVIGINKEGALERAPFQDWVLYTRGKAPDPTGRKNTIVSVDIAGNAAVVKTDLNWPSVRYIDYLSLMKVDGEWRIVSKIFHRGTPEAQS